MTNLDNEVVLFERIEKLCNTLIFKIECKILLKLMLIKRTIQILSDPTYHSQCPLTGFEKKNVSKVCRIFLESISDDNSKMVCLKILALGISELTLLNGPKNVKN